MPWWIAFQLLLRDRPAQKPMWLVVVSTVGTRRFVNGARGLIFYGGEFTQVMRNRDAHLGWNWTFWELVLRPLLQELTSPSVLPALLAPNAHSLVRAANADVQTVSRRDGKYLHAIAVNTNPMNHTEQSR